jgi:hypothetical protein
MPTCAEIVKAAIDPIWLDYEYIGIRLQSGAESKRTKAGQKLRPSSVWDDGRKLRDKLPGTAAFLVRDLAQIAEVLDAMSRHGYAPRKADDRLVVIGSNDGCWGSDMPERFATAIKNAVLLAVIPKEMYAKKA